MAIVLVGGGARSGKSAFALARARELGEKRALIATAEPLDEEMRQRIQAHQSARGDEFVTIEAPVELSGVFKWQSSRYDVIVVDCLTLWLSNVLRSGDNDVEHHIELLLAAVKECRCNLVLVANEVGCGIVPDNELARRFRDLAGRLNQQLAEMASEVRWMVFGCPLKVR